MISWDKWFEQSLLRLHAKDSESSKIPFDPFVMMVKSTSRSSESQLMPNPLLSRLEFFLPQRFLVRDKKQRS